MADVILTQVQADDLYHALQAITEWCSDENFESALGSLTDNFGIADPLGRITELVGILQAENQTQTQQEEGDLTMQIIMNQVEIETAITDFVSRQINISTDQEITIELQATRGANGYTATLGIMPRIGGAPTPAEDAAPLATTAIAARNAQRETAEAKAEPKPVAKPTLGIAPKAKGLLLKAQAEAEAEVEAEAVEPEVATKAYTGEDDGADDEVENSMASSSREEEPPMNETVKTSDAPPPRSIFSKSKAG